MVRGERCACERNNHFSSGFLLAAAVAYGINAHTLGKSEGLRLESTLVNKIDPSVFLAAVDDLLGQSRLSVANAIGVSSTALPLANSALLFQASAPYNGRELPAVSFFFLNHKLNKVCMKFGQKLIRAPFAAKSSKSVRNSEWDRDYVTARLIDGEDDQARWGKVKSLLFSSDLTEKSLLSSLGQCGYKRISADVPMNAEHFAMTYKLTKTVVNRYWDKCSDKVISFNFENHELSEIIIETSEGYLCCSNPPNALWQFFFGRDMVCD